MGRQFLSKEVQNKKREEEMSVVIKGSVCVHVCVRVFVFYWLVGVRACASTRVVLVLE